MSDDGALGILNVGGGDTTLSFDPSKPEEAKRAASVVEDMLKRGYAILVKVGTAEDGKALYKRAEGFDAATYEYIIIGTPEPTGDALMSPQRRPRKIRVPAATTRAVSVARSAGG